MAGILAGTQVGAHAMDLHARLTIMLQHQPIREA